MGYLQQYSFWLLKKLFEKPLDPKYVCVCVCVYKTHTSIYWNWQMTKLGVSVVKQNSFLKFKLYHFWLDEVKDFD